MIYMHHNNFNNIIYMLHFTHTGNCLGCCPSAPHKKFDCFFPEMFDS